ncbi:hypothetical protein ZIOFF_005336 [Zingiber officinale]|uniref:Uncharacterized protein n=1 Tax=Zingiber officinale TaxID=94328 RepID=A0A8J5LUT5_ZINOF|nr:hypothetical protein ZIOFF_005336 [Zingiber officinale]
MSVHTRENDYNVRVCFFNLTAKERNPATSVLAVHTHHVLLPRRPSTGSYRHPTPIHLCSASSSYPRHTSSNHSRGPAPCGPIRPSPNDPRLLTSGIPASTRHSAFPRQPVPVPSLDLALPLHTIRLVASPASGLIRFAPTPVSTLFTFSIAASSAIYQVSAVSLFAFCISVKL